MRPSLRFTDKTDWKNYFIYELCDILTGYPFEGNTIKSKGKNALMRGINITEGYIRHSRDIDRFFDGDTKLLNKYRLKLNDLVIGMDGSKVGKNSALVTEKETGALLVQRVARLRSNDIDTIKLLLQLFGSKRFFKYVDNIKTSSAIPHISLADIKQFVVALPTEEHEKNSLSSFCELVRRHTALSQAQLYKLQKIKSACLHSMFPQEGELVPKVRFNGFNEDWERRNLSEIATFRKGKGYSKSDLEYHGTPIILYGSLYTNYNLKISKINSFVHEKVGSYKSEGYEIIVPASGETAEDIARASVVAQKGIILGGDLNIICVDKDSFVPEFIALLITYGQPHKYLTKVAQGKSVVHLHNSDISRICILCPSLEEQQKISAYFENLDKQISLQTQRLKKLKQIKSACLDKMFV